MPRETPSTAEQSREINWAAEKKCGSAQESDRAPISCGFLKGDEFYLRGGQALGLQQQIA
jgi:hypothetical protein